MKCVGRTETVCFPEMETGPIAAKIDTGAYGNAMHADDISVQDDILSFYIGGTRHFFSEFDTVVVRNSFGKKQKRYSVRLNMKLGNKSYRIMVSLTSREKMKYPVLIGRRFLRKFGYMVDVSRKDVNDKAQQS